jgi:PAS domain-containing protein
MNVIRTPLGRHVVAAAVVLLTFVGKELIERLVGPGPPLIFFVPAVTISAWQGRGGPGLLATALALAVCDIIYFPPIGSLAVHSPNDVAHMMAFAFDGVVTSVLMEWLHRARRQAEESRRDAGESRQAMRRTDERFRSIIDNTDALIFMKNIRLEYDVMNKKLREILGVGEGKVAGLSDHDVFPKDVAEAIQATDRTVLQEGKA